MSDPDTIYRQSSSAVACPLGDGVAILNTDNNQYYSLNPVGAFVWSALEQRSDVQQLVGQIAREFAVDEARCQRDLEALLADLEKEGLVKRQTS